MAASALRIASTSTTAMALLRTTSHMSMTVVMLRSKDIGRRWYQNHRAPLDSLKEKALRGFRRARPKEHFLHADVIAAQFKPFRDDVAMQEKKPVEYDQLTMLADELRMAIEKVRWELLEETVESMTSSELANLFDSLGTLRIPTASTIHLRHHMERRVIDFMEQNVYAQEDMLDIVVGHARMGDPSAKVLQAGIQGMSSFFHEFTTEQLTTFARAFTKARFASVPFFNELQESMKERLSDSDPMNVLTTSDMSHIASMLSSAARLGIPLSIDFVEMATTRIAKDGNMDKILSIDDQVVLLWSLLWGRHHDSVHVNALIKSVVADIRGAASKNIKMDPKKVNEILEVDAMLRLEANAEGLPIDVVEFLESSRPDHVSMSTRAVKKVNLAMRSLLIKCKTSKDMKLGGYYVDVSLDGSRIAIELDTKDRFSLEQPHHLLGPTELKHRLLRSTGWRIFTVPFWDFDLIWSPASARRYFIDHMGSTDLLPDE